MCVCVGGGMDRNICNSFQYIWLDFIMFWLYLDLALHPHFYVLFCVISFAYPMRKSFWFVIFYLIVATVCHVPIICRVLFIRFSYLNENSLVVVIVLFSLSIFLWSRLSVLCSDFLFLISKRPAHRFAVRCLRLSLFFSGFSTLDANDIAVSAIILFILFDRAAILGISFHFFPFCVLSVFSTCF